MLPQTKKKQRIVDCEVTTDTAMTSVQLWHKHDLASACKSSRVDTNILKADCKLCHAILLVQSLVLIKPWLLYF